MSLWDRYIKIRSFIGEKEQVCRIDILKLEVLSEKKQVRWTNPLKLKILSEKRAVSRDRK